MTNTAYKTRKLLSMLSCAEKENDGLMLTHNLQNMQRYAIQPYDTVRLEGKTYITSGCHNKGTRLLIPVNGKSKSVAISKVQVVCHAGAWIQII